MLNVSHLLALSALVVATPTLAHETKQTLMPEDEEGLTFQNAVGFSDAVIAGDTVYLAGVVATPAPDATSMKPAFDEAFTRIGKTLTRAGVSWDDVVDMTTYHTDLQGQVAEFVEVKNKYIKAPFPAWTAIGISELFEPTGLVEIKIVARKPKPAAE